MKRALIALTALAVASTLPALAQRDSESARQERQNNSLKNWISEDVSYIITEEERAAFEALSTDEERHQFIEQFWLRRDPTPDTLLNEYQQEHYRRIAYANQHFTSGIPGWRTDRGRIYILWGPPDQIEQYPTGGAYDRRFDEGGGRTNVFPFERWRYRYLPLQGGGRQEVELEFVDQSFSNEYRLALSPHEKDALANVPGAGFTEYELLSADPERARSLRGIGVPNPLNPDMNNDFDLLELWGRVFEPAEVEFRDLETIVTTNLSYNQVPFDAQTHFIKVLEDSILTPVTVQVRNSDITYEERDGVHVGEMNVFGRVTSITGRVDRTFEQAIEIDLLDREFEARLDDYHVYQEQLYLAPGAYQLDLVIKDITSGDLGTLSRRLDVPPYPEGELSASSLILAHKIEPVPSRLVGTAMFHLGDLKVVPTVNNQFDRAGNLAYWIQVYDLAVDQASRPSARIETIITREGREVLRLVETTEELSSAARYLTIDKTIPLADFSPGQYNLQVRVIDNISGGVTSQSSPFVVTQRASE